MSSRCRLLLPQCRASHRRYRDRSATFRTRRGDFSDRRTLTEVELDLARFVGTLVGLVHDSFVDLWEFALQLVDHDACSPTGKGEKLVASRPATSGLPMTSDDPRAIPQADVDRHPV